MHRLTPNYNYSSYIYIGTVIFQVRYFKSKNIPQKTFVYVLESEGISDFAQSSYLIF